MELLIVNLLKIIVYITQCQDFLIQIKLLIVIQWNNWRCILCIWPSLVTTEHVLLENVLYGVLAILYQFVNIILYQLIQLTSQVGVKKCLILQIDPEGMFQQFQLQIVRILQVVKMLLHQQLKMIVISKLDFQIVYWFLKLEVLTNV